MRALLVATENPDAHALLEAIRQHGLDVARAAPSEVTADFADQYSMFVVFPRVTVSELAAAAEACRRLRTAPNPVPLLLAVARDAQQIDTLLDAGADDFLLWPLEGPSLQRRLDICRFRIKKRERDVIRSRDLVEAVRDAELGEQRFRQLAESSTEILMRCSPGGIRLYVSPRCYGILGYDSDQLIGTSIFNIVHPGDAPVLMDVLDQVELGADVATAVIRHQCTDAAFVWLEVTCRAVRDPGTHAIVELILVARDVTALVHIEHDKLEAQGQFDSFASRAPVGIFKIDNDGNCIFINARACELIGITPQQAHGSGWMSLVDVRDMATFAESSIQKAGDEKVYNWEMAIRRQGGQKVWLSIKATATRSRTGQITGYLATILDVTREQRARQELMASEERFRSIVERITELVCRYLPDGTLTFVNDAYCRAFGAKPEDLLGKSFLPLLPEEDRHEFAKVVARLSPMSPVTISVHRAIVPGGELRWQEWYDRGIFDDDGRLIEIVGTARDITERHNFKQELADAGNFLRDVLDAVRDPITVEGIDGKYVMVNRAFAELVGSVREALVGFPVAAVRPDARVLRWPEVSDEQEITWPMADGQLRSLFEKRAVLADRQGHQVLVSVMRDVTERKRYEAQLALSERLASLGTLAGGIAHEINNPLSYVIGNLSFAVDSLDPNRPVDADMPSFTEVHKALSEAHEGAQRIARIVRDVRVFSRADRDTLKLVEPLRIIETSLRMVQTNLERRAVVSREIEDVPHILANEARLAQVMVNLLVNAVQALPERPVRENRIVVAVRADQRFVIMEVRDNGQGISDENMRHIFDPFFTTKPVGEGMGLGLSICNSIVIAHGGRIEIETALGKGSAFRIVLPAVVKPAPKRAA